MLENQIAESIDLLAAVSPCRPANPLKTFAFRAFGSGTNNF